MLFKYHLFLDRRQLLSLFFAIFSGWMTVELLRDDGNAWWVFWVFSFIRIFYWIRNNIVFWFIWSKYSFFYYSKTFFFNITMTLESSYWHFSIVCWASTYIFH